MMPGHRLLGSILCAALFMAAAFAAEDKGSQFDSPDGRVSFWAPMPPRVVVDEIPSQSGKPYKRTTYVMEAETFMLLASSLELNAGPDTAGDEDSFLDSMLDSIRNGFGDKFQLDSKGGVTAVTLAPNNLKGRQLRATVEGHPMIIRAYVGKRTIYTMQVSHMQGDQAAAKTGERFLESLVVKSP